MSENVHWEIDDLTARLPSAADVRQIERELATLGVEGSLRGAAEAPNLAVRLKDIFIDDNDKLFGSANIRLDALVVHGNADAVQAGGFYAPETFRFSGVRDKYQLPTGDTGLLLFVGKPLHFLDIFITASRETKDSDDLATLLSDQLQSDEAQTAIKALLALTAVAPQAAAVAAAVSAAAMLGNLAYKVVRLATGNSIGMYRTAYLQHRDNFGIGEHPDDGDGKVFIRHNALSFKYEILEDTTPP